MLSELWSTVLDFLKEQPFWRSIQPIIALSAGYLFVAFAGYEYIHWLYRLSPDISLYIRSYLFKQLSLLYAGLAILFLIFYASPTKQPQAWNVRLRQSLKSVRWGKVLAVMVVVFATAIGVLRLAPRHASEIRIIFLAEPGNEFSKYALVYIIYELNKLQPDWFFEVNPDPFNPDFLDSSERDRCDKNEFSCAEAMARGKPAIAITTKPLQDAFFGFNIGSTSLISTFDWQKYSPPNVYEYLAYSIVMQSVTIHLNKHCGGLAESSFAPAKASQGDVLGFAPRRQTIKAEIL